MKTAFAILSTVLGRYVFITNAQAASEFAEEQTAHTGTPHTAEPVEIHDDASKLNAQIDERHRAAAAATMNAGQKRVFGLTDPTGPEPSAAAKPTAPVRSPAATAKGTETATS